MAGTSLFVCDAHREFRRYYISSSSSASEEADLIAAEDTRNSIRLLNHFEIDRRR